MNWVRRAVRQNEIWVHYWKRYVRKLGFHTEYAELYRYCMKALAEAEGNLRQARKWLREYRRIRRSRKKVKSPFFLSVGFYLAV